MKVWVCAMVIEGGDPEPTVETRVATTERDACHKLLKLWDDSPFEEDWDPFSLAQFISGQDQHFYVEEHTLAAP